MRGQSNDADLREVADVSCVATRSKRCGFLKQDKIVARWFDDRSRDRVEVLGWFAVVSEVHVAQRPVVRWRAARALAVHEPVAAEHETVYVCAVRIRAQGKDK